MNILYSVWNVFFTIVLFPLLFPYFNLFLIFRYEHCCYRVWYLIQINYVSFFSDKSCFNDDIQCSKLRKHLSKSASELSAGKYSTDWQNSSPQRAKSAVNPSVAGVIQKTHGFFSTLKVFEKKFNSFYIYENNNKIIALI